MFDFSCMHKSAPAGALHAICPAQLVSDRIKNYCAACLSVQASCQAERPPAGMLHGLVPRMAALQPHLCCWSAVLTQCSRSDPLHSWCAGAMSRGTAPCIRGLTCGSAAWPGARRSCPADAPRAAERPR